MTSTVSMEEVLMVTQEELNGFRRDRYFSRSWALLTGQKGWIKPVLLMALALLVPIVGWLGVMGYIVEWARLTAWGANTAPKQKGVHVGACIKSGWRIFVIDVCWTLVLGVVGALLSVVPLLGGLLALAWFVFGLVLTVALIAAEIRATIYQRMGAGFRLGIIKDMVSRDMPGVWRIAGMCFLLGAGLAIVAGVLTFGILMATLPLLIFRVSYISPLVSEGMAVAMALDAVGDFLLTSAPALIVVGFVTNILAVIVNCLVYTAVALWMRQFDVPNWGRNEDPLPDSVRDPRDSDGVCYGLPVTPATAPAPQDAPAEPVAPAAPVASVAPPAPAAPVAPVPPAPVPPAAIAPAAPVPPAPAAPQQPADPEVAPAPDVPAFYQKPAPAAPVPEQPTAAEPVTQPVAPAPGQPVEPAPATQPVAPATEQPAMPAPAPAPADAPAPSAIPAPPVPTPGDDAQA